MNNKIVSDEFLEKVASHSPECGCTVCKKREDEINEEMMEELESRREEFEVDRYDSYQHSDTE